MHIRVDAVGGNAVADIVGNDDRVAFGGQQAFQREGLRGGFKTGADGVVAHQDEVLDGAVGRQEQFPGQFDDGAVRVVSVVNAGNVDEPVAVDDAQHVPYQRDGLRAGYLGLGLPFGFPHQGYFRV